jgi:hypothetical protein
MTSKTTKARNQRSSDAEIAAYRDVIMMLVQAMAGDPDWFTPPDDGDHLRSALARAANILRAVGDTDAGEGRARQIEAVLWEPIEFVNEYECSCGTAWSNTHTCACDDECPDCGADTSPTRSERVDDIANK